MINSISIEEAIALLGSNVVGGSFVEKYIPSKDVKAKIESDNWIFSDRDKAAIIWNSDKMLSERYADLIMIMQETDDEILKCQISERIRYDALAFKLFNENKQGFIYATNTYEFPGEDCIIGYFASMELAYEAGIREGYSFKIEKFQIVGEDTVRMERWSVVSPLLAKDEGQQLEEFDIPGSPVAALKYDVAGKLMDYWSYEVSKEDKLLVDPLGRHRFENAYVVLPNPFELGEYVRLIGTTEVGRVDVSQENWARYVKKALQRDAIDDYSDASITVRYNYDKWAHMHLSPLYLERVDIDKSYIPMVVMSGHDSGNAYWIRPVKVQDEGYIYLGEVEELNPEISVPAEHVKGIVFEIFKRYLDMELPYNKRRVRFDYDSNGKCVVGFGIDMIHNFYDVEHIEKMASNLIAVSLYIFDRNYTPEQVDISEHVVKEINKFDSIIAELNEVDQFERKWEYAEFLRDLADRIMRLISYGKDKDAIISIMAP